MIYAGTGHRPDKLGGYGKPVRVRLIRFARAQLRLDRPDKVMSGMAQGWDTALAIAAIKERIPLIGVMPFVNFGHHWPVEAQQRRDRILERAETTVIVSGGVGDDEAERAQVAAWLQQRNEYMVDNSDRLLALWDGTTGGTWNCIRYAQRSDRPVKNLWSAWLKFDG